VLPISDDECLAYVLEHRWRTEDVIDAARRILVSAALERSGGRQDIAAEVLGVSKRKINYDAARYYLRPKDMKAAAMTEERATS